MNPVSERSRGISWLRIGYMFLLLFATKTCSQQEENCGSTLGIENGAISDIDCFLDTSISENDCSQKCEDIRYNSQNEDSFWCLESIDKRPFYAGYFPHFVELSTIQFQQPEGCNDCLNAKFNFQYSIDGVHFQNYGLVKEKEFQLLEIDGNLEINVNKTLLKAVKLTMIELTGTFKGRFELFGCNYWDDFHTFGIASGELDDSNLESVPIVPSAASARLNNSRRGWNPSQLDPLLTDENSPILLKIQLPYMYRLLALDVQQVINDNTSLPCPIRIKFTYAAERKTYGKWLQPVYNSGKVTKHLLQHTIQSKSFELWPREFQVGNRLYFKVEMYGLKQKFPPTYSMHAEMHEGYDSGLLKQSFMPNAHLRNGALTVNHTSLISTLPFASDDCIVFPNNCEHGFVMAFSARVPAPVFPKLHQNSDINKLCSGAKHYYGFHFSELHLPGVVVDLNSYWATTAAHDRLYAQVRFYPNSPPEFIADCQFMDAPLSEAPFYLYTAVPKHSSGSYYTMTTVTKSLLKMAMDSQYWREGQLNSLSIVIVARSTPIGHFQIRPFMSMDFGGLKDNVLDNHAPIVLSSSSPACPTETLSDVLFSSVDTLWQTCEDIIMQLNSTVAVTMVKIRGGEQGYVNRFSVHHSRDCTEWTQISTPAGDAMIFEKKHWYTEYVALPQMVFTTCVKITILDYQGILSQMKVDLVQSAKGERASSIMHSGPSMVGLITNYVMDGTQQFVILETKKVMKSFSGGLTEVGQTLCTRNVHSLKEETYCQYSEPNKFVYRFTQRDWTEREAPLFVGRQCDSYAVSHNHAFCIKDGLLYYKQSKYCEKIGVHLSSGAHKIDFLYTPTFEDCVQVCTKLSWQLPLASGAATMKPERHISNGNCHCVQGSTSFTPNGNSEGCFLRPASDIEPVYQNIPQLRTKRHNQVLTLDHLPLAYKLSFKFKYKNKNGNACIASISHTGNSGSTYVDRIFRLLRMSGKVLQFSYFHASLIHVYLRDLAHEVWHKVSVSQRWSATGYVYKVTVNDVVVIEVLNVRAREVRGVQVSFGDQDGSYDDDSSVSNVHFVKGEEGQFILKAHGDSDCEEMNRVKTAEVCRQAAAYVKIKQHIDPPSYQSTNYWQYTYGCIYHPAFHQMIFNIATHNQGSDSHGTRRVCLVNWKVAQAASGLVADVATDGRKAIMYDSAARNLLLFDPYNEAWVDTDTVQGFSNQDCSYIKGLEDGTVYCYKQPCIYVMNGLTYAFEKFYCPPASFLFQWLEADADFVYVCADKKIYRIQRYLGTNSIDKDYSAAILTSNLAAAVPSEGLGLSVGVHSNSRVTAALRLQDKWYSVTVPPPTPTTQYRQFYVKFTGTQLCMQVTLEGEMVCQEIGHSNLLPSKMSQITSHSIKLGGHASHIRDYFGGKLAFGHLKFWDLQEVPLGNIHTYVKLQKPIKFSSKPYVSAMSEDFTITNICGDGYSVKKCLGSSDGKIFYMGDGCATFTEAENWCKQTGGALAVVEDETQRDQMVAASLQFTNEATGCEGALLNVFVGVKDNTWLDGTEVNPALFGPAPPTGCGRLSVDSSPVFQPAACDEPAPFMCRAETTVWQKEVALVSTMTTDACDAVDYDAGGTYKVGGSTPATIVFVFQLPIESVQTAYLKFTSSDAAISSNISIALVDADTDCSTHMSLENAYVSEIVHFSMTDVLSEDVAPLLYLALELQMESVGLALFWDGSSDEKQIGNISLLLNYLPTDNYLRFNPPPSGQQGLFYRKFETETFQNPVTSATFEYYLGGSESLGILAVWMVGESGHASQVFVVRGEDNYERWRTAEVTNNEPSVKMIFIAYQWNDGVIAIDKIEPKNGLNNIFEMPIPFSDPVRRLAWLNALGVNDPVLFLPLNSRTELNITDPSSVTFTANPYGMPGEAIMHTDANDQPVTILQQPDTEFNTTEGFSLLLHVFCPLQRTVIGVIGGNIGLHSNGKSGFVLKNHETSTVYLKTAANSFPIGEWLFLALVCSAKTCKVYFNNEEVKSVDDVEFSFASTFSLHTTLYEDTYQRNRTLSCLQIYRGAITEKQLKILKLCPHLNNDVVCPGCHNGGYCVPLEQRCECDMYGRMIDHTTCANIMSLTTESMKAHTYMSFEGIHDHLTAVLNDSFPTPSIINMGRCAGDTPIEVSRNVDWCDALDCNEYSFFLWLFLNDSRITEIFSYAQVRMSLATTSSTHHTVFANLTWIRGGQICTKQIMLPYAQWFSVQVRENEQKRHFISSHYYLNLAPANADKCLDGEESIESVFRIHPHVCADELTSWIGLTKNFNLYKSYFSRSRKVVLPHVYLPSVESNTQQVLSSKFKLSTTRSMRFLLKRHVVAAGNTHWFILGNDRVRSNNLNLGVRVPSINLEGGKLVIAVMLDKQPFQVIQKDTTAVTPEQWVSVFLNVFEWEGKWHTEIYYNGIPLVQPPYTNNMAIDDVELQTLHVASESEGVFKDMAVFTTYSGLDDVNLDCKDSDGRCQGWAPTGECSANPNSMKPNCQLSCGTCPKFTANGHREIILSPSITLVVTSSDYSTMESVDEMRTARQNFHNLISTFMDENDNFEGWEIRINSISQKDGITTSEVEILTHAYIRPELMFSNVSIQGEVLEFRKRTYTIGYSPNTAVDMRAPVLSGDPFSPTHIRVAVLDLHNNITLMHPYHYLGLNVSYQQFDKSGAFFTEENKLIFYPVLDSAWIPVAPYKKTVVIVRILYHGGTSYPANITIESGLKVNTIPPDVTNVSAINSTSIHVDWNDFLIAWYNAPELVYHLQIVNVTNRTLLDGVYYENCTTTNYTLAFHRNTTDNRTLFEGLHPYTHYAIRISTINSVGEGTSVCFNERTKPTDPLPVTGFNVSVTSTQLFAEWHAMPLNDINSERLLGYALNFTVERPDIVNYPVCVNWNIMIPPDQNVYVVANGCAPKQHMMLSIQAVSDYSSSPPEFQCFLFPESVPVGEVGNLTATNVTVDDEFAPASVNVTLGGMEFLEEQSVITYYEITVTSLEFPDIIDVFNATLQDVQFPLFDENRTLNCTYRPPDSALMTSYLLDQLYYNMWYELSVRAASRKGVSLVDKQLVFWTPHHAPTCYPSDIKLSNVSSAPTTLNLEYVPLDRFCLHSPLVFYGAYVLATEIYLSLDNITHETLSAIVPMVELLVDTRTFQGLHEYWNYTCVMFARNTVGDGMFSPPVFAMTADAPISGAPSGLNVTNASNESVTLVWHDIDRYEKNSLITHFLVTATALLKNGSYHNIVQKVNASELSCSLDVFADHTYSFTVAGVARFGSGPEADVQVTTDKMVASTGPDNFLVSCNVTNLTLSWEHADIMSHRANFSHYLVRGYGVLHNGTVHRVVLETEDTELELTGFFPGTWYRFDVATVNEVGVGPNSTFDILVDEMHPLAPVRDLVQINITATEAFLNWTHVERMSQRGVVYYHVVATPFYHPWEIENLRIVSVSVNTTWSLIEGLNNRTHYNVTVTPMTSAGPGPQVWINFTTLENVPRAGPEELILETLTSSSLGVSWSLLPAEFSEGVVIGYNVSYCLPEDYTPPKPHVGELCSYVEVNATTTEIVLKGLSLNADYVVRVAGMTEVGCGTFTDPLIQRTDIFVDGGWSLWTDWGNCDRSCGRGNLRRYRYCINPIPQAGGDHCAGETTQLQQCNDFPCHGIYLAQAGDSCFTACGSLGEEYFCSSVFDTQNSTDIYKNIYDVQDFHLKSNLTCAAENADYMSPQHPVYTDNSKCEGFVGKPLLTDCNATSGLQQQRICNCLDLESTMFAPWTGWAYVCSSECGVGMLMRQRECVLEDGCPNREAQALGDCSVNPCPVHGNWGEWGAVGNCSRACGYGLLSRRRRCDSPAPYYGGEDCPGDAVDVMDSCNYQPCPIDGGWSRWGEISESSQPCGSGCYRRQKRYCNNPEPLYDGKRCPGNDTKYYKCEHNRECKPVKIDYVVHLVEKEWHYMMYLMNHPYSVNITNQVHQATLESFWNCTYSNLNEIADYLVIEFLKLWRGSVIASYSVTYLSGIPLAQQLFYQDILDNVNLLNGMTVKLKSINSTTVPVSPPPNVFGISITPSTIDVSWKDPNRPELLHGNFYLYYVYYKEATSDSDWQHVGTRDTQIRIKDLRFYTTYDIRVLISNPKGNGVASPNIQVTTLEGVPLIAPPNCWYQILSYDTVFFAWDYIPQEFVPGRLIGYEIKVRRYLGTESTKTIAYRNFFGINVDGFHGNEVYWVEVAGFTRAGVGPHVLFTFKTPPGPPRIAPPNAQAVSFTSWYSIFVQWDPIPPSFENGRMSGYRLEYLLLETSGKPVVGEEWQEITFDKFTYQHTLVGLKSYSRYHLRISGYALQGDGPKQDLFANTCSCPRYIFSNWYQQIPFIYFDEEGEVSGILPTFFREMIAAVCSPCLAYQKHEFFFVESKDGTPSQKADEKTVRLSVNDSTVHLSFPIRQRFIFTQLSAEFPFVGVIPSPGSAMIVYKPFVHVLGFKSVLMGVVRSWPLIAITCLLAALFGIAFWFGEQKAEYSDIDQTSFMRGVLQGFWLAFITMTTVGYGDFTLYSAKARAVMIIWTFAGLLTYCMLGGAISSAMSVMSKPNQYSLYDTKVAVLSDSNEYSYAIRKNAIFNKTYKNFSQLLDAVTSREVEIGFLEVVHLIGHEKELESRDVQVYKVLDLGIGHGVALSAELKNIELDVNSYVRTNQQNILEVLKRDYGTIEPSTKETEEVLFDDEELKSLFLHMFIVIVTLSFIGIVKAYVIPLFSKNSVEPSTRVKELHDLDTLVESFHTRFTRVEDMIHTHMHERIELNDLQRVYARLEKQHSKVGEKYAQER